MVSIIPKPTKKIPEWHKLAFYASLALVGVVILGYACLFFLESRALSTLQDLEDKIAQVGTKTEKNMEAQVLADKKRINDFSKLISSHQKSTSFLQILEENTHPKVWFSELSLRPAEAQATIYGQTLNFQTLGEQYLIFKTVDLIESISLSNLAIGEEGQAEFSFLLGLDPQIFK